MLGDLKAWTNKLQQTGQNQGRVFSSSTGWTHNIR